MYQHQLGCEVKGQLKLDPYYHLDTFVVIYFNALFCYHTWYYYISLGPATILGLNQMTQLHAIVICFLNRDLIFVCWNQNNLPSIFQNHLLLNRIVQVHCSTGSDVKGFIAQWFMVVHSPCSMPSRAPFESKDLYKNFIGFKYYFFSYLAFWYKGLNLPKSYSKSSYMLENFLWVYFSHLIPIFFPTIQSKNYFCVL